MELLGKWKIKKVACITPYGFSLCAPEELPKDADYDEYRIMSKAVIDFRPDGIAYQLLSPDLYAALGREEEAPLLDGMVVVEQHPWKEEDGAYYYHTGEEGDICGVPVDPYERLEPDADGCIPLCAGLMLIERL